MAKVLGVILAFVLFTLVIACIATFCIAIVLPLFLLCIPFGIQGAIVYVFIWAGIIEWHVRRER